MLSQAMLPKRETRRRQSGPLTALCETRFPTIRTGDMRNEKAYMYLRFPWGNQFDILVCFSSCIFLI